MGNDLVLLADRTSLNVFWDPGSHVWPPITALGLSDGFVSAGVSSNQPFMYNLHDFSLDGEIGGNH